MNDTETDSAVFEIYYTWNAHAPLTLHICAVLFVVISGIVGNGMIIYI